MATTIAATSSRGRLWSLREAFAGALISLAVLLKALGEPRALWKPQVMTGELEVCARSCELAVRLTGVDCGSAAGGRGGGCRAR